MFSEFGTNVYVRLIQVSGRQSVTVIIGLDEDIDTKKVLRAMKRSMSCNGTIKDGNIQLQGDHRADSARWLIEHKIVERRDLRVS
jgi:translation initiation factor SUI1